MAKKGDKNISQCIGGWLVLLLVIHILTLIGSLALFLVYTFSILGIISLVNLILLILLLLFFFKKKKIYVKIAYFQIWFNVIFLTSYDLVKRSADYVANPSYAFGDLVYDLIQYSIIALAITFYLVKSKRVKNTFIK